VLDGSQEDGRHHGVIADYRQTVAVGQVGDFAKLRHIILGITDALEVEAAGVFVDELFDLLGMVGVEEADFDVELFEGLTKEGPGAAIEVGGGDEILAGMGDGQDRSGDSSLSAGKGQAGRSAVQSSQAFFQHIVGGVHQAGVDIAELLQGEEVRGVVGVFEYVAGGGVDGHGPGGSGRVGLLPGVQGQGCQTVILLRAAHGLILSCV